MRPALVYSPAYVADLPAGHRFPMPKFKALFERLKERGLAEGDRLVEVVPAPRAWLETAHAPGYVTAILEQTLPEAAARRLGFPLNLSIARRSRAAVAGTVQAARLALEEGLAMNLAGGSHHAHADYGAGFCVFNDVAVAARLLRAEGRIRSALIVDLDVHQGDGTAAICRGDPAIVTCSVHCATNFPARKETSDVDLALAAETGDGAYLAALGALLPPLLERSRPDLVFFNAGVDPHADDRLGRLALSDKGLAEREAFVLELCRKNGLPLVCVVGGGYGRTLEEVVDRHMILHEVARDLPPW